MIRTHSPANDQLAPSSDSTSRILGSHPRLDDVRTFARRAARVPFARVLITGASGTGKSLLAREIHDLSHARGEFVAVNCAALPGHLLESELFGHEKGAFTDARTAKPGLLELAHEGTVLLDEIGALPLELQAKLLLFLETHEVRRVGGVRGRLIRTRVIAATNEDLHERVRERTFRADLLYRLDVASLALPSLCELPGVAEELARHFVLQLCDEMGLRVPDITAATFARLCDYSWPGNVRELRNAVERALVLNEGTGLEIPTPSPARSTRGEFVMPYGLTLEEVERRYLAAVMNARPDQDFVKLAPMLGISRKTLWEKRKKYGLR